MGTGDRHGGRTGDAARGRAPAGTPREPGGLLERYSKGGTGRPNERRRDRPPSRSRHADDTYDDRYNERPASRNGHSSSRDHRDDRDDERHRPQRRSRTRARDDDYMDRRRAEHDRYPEQARGDRGRHADARPPARSRRALGDAQPPRVRSPREVSRPRQSSRRGVLFVALAVALVAVPLLLVFGVWPRLHGLAGNQINTRFPWAGSTQETAASPDNAAFATQHDAVDPAFQTYYTAHAGTTTLGTPLTPGFLTRSGIVQFFAYGALLTAVPAPGAASNPTATAGTPSAAATATTAPKTTTRAVPPTPGDGVLQLVGTGPTLSGAGTAGSGGVVALPVVAALLRAGGQTPVVDGATMTYVDLRRAAGTDQLAAGTQPSPLPSGTATQPVFITTDTQNGKSQGHAIPPALWTYINRPDVSPAGWQTDIGAPLTEAQTVTATQSGATHHLLIQAFWNAVLVADADTLTSAQPSIARASIGRDLLLTLGPPAVAVGPNTTAWALGDAAVLDAPVSGNATVHVGENFPLALSGESKWNKATLWFGASWSVGASRSGKGWVAGASLTFAPPDPSQPASVSFDVLSPDLAAYVSGQGKNMGVAVYDLTRNIYYGYNDTQTFVLASTAKVYIMASYLDWVEGQGRGLRSDELSSLTAMIEHSDNNAAQLLYDRVGGIGGQQRFLKKIDITDYASCVYGWGCAQLSAADAVHILTLLQQGKILNDSDRKLAFTLMGNIESDQRWGVGDTAPKGATFYMKDGWLQYPADPWDLNSVGIVTLGGETYVIGVYSQNNLSFDWSKVQHVCGTVGQLLTS